MAKQTQNWGAFVLEFLGSLAYLFVAFVLPGGLAVTSGLFAGAGGLWLPFFAATAVLASVALFFISFGNLWNIKGIGKAALCATVAGGFALVALSYTNLAYLGTTLVGFILALIGTGLAYK